MRGSLRTGFVTFLGLVCVCVLSGSGQQAPGPTAPTASDQGKSVFLKSGCGECHGFEGQGAPSSGPRIAPDPLPLAAFKLYVRSPRNYMPPYTSKVLSDEALADIHAYLTSRPHPPANVLPPS